MHQALEIPALDGYTLAAELFEPSPALANGKALIISSATAVDKKLYFHYASYLSKRGYTVVSYDYRGIAASRPPKLRGFPATFNDWAQLDFEGIIHFVQEKYPGYTLLTLGHSIGGTIVGWTKRCADIQGLITVGAQTSYYKDWPAKQRQKIYFQWHVLIPWLTYFYGYFPGKALGMLEDVPYGVVQQWHARRKLSNMNEQIMKDGQAPPYDQFRGKLLTLGLTDDPIGTEVALRRVHDLFTQASEKELRMIRPKDIGADAVGHFHFFRRRFEDTLWKMTWDFWEQI